MNHTRREAAVCLFLIVLRSLKARLKPSSPSSQPGDYSATTFWMWKWYSLKKKKKKEFKISWRGMRRRKSERSALCQGMAGSLWGEWSAAFWSVLRWLLICSALSSNWVKYGSSPWMRHVQWRQQKPQCRSLTTSAQIDCISHTYWSELVPSSSR